MFSNNLMGIKCKTHTNKAGKFRSEKWNKDESKSKVIIIFYVTILMGYEICHWICPWGGAMPL
jgi:hypothetical protein